MELYNEHLYDLLVPRSGADLAIREDRDKNILIPDLTEVPTLMFTMAYNQLLIVGPHHLVIGVHAIVWKWMQT